LEEKLLAKTRIEASSRVKLATVAAVNSQEESLQEQLNRINDDAPLVLLAARLKRLLGPSLDSLPGGALGALGRLTQPPPDDAWMGQQRATLAELCRAAAEADWARRNGVSDLAMQIDHYISALATDLLSEVDDHARATLLPGVSGFDGSDPDPKLDMRR
jgi:hypothetical protein